MLFWCITKWLEKLPILKDAKSKRKSYNKYKILCKSFCQQLGYIIVLEVSVVDTVAVWRLWQDPLAGPSCCAYTTSLGCPWMSEIYIYLYIYVFHGKPIIWLEGVRWLEEIWLENQWHRLKEKVYQQISQDGQEVLIFVSHVNNHQRAISIEKNDRKTIWPILWI